LIKDIIHHYNKKLKIKDAKILAINRTMKETNESFNKYQAESEDLEKNATRDGINESINQIKFLQTEVFTCRNKLSDEIKFIDALKIKLNEANKLKQEASDHLNEMKRQHDSILENNSNLDERLRDMQQEYILLQRNIKFKDQKDSDLNAQRIFETNRIKLKE